MVVNSAALQPELDGDPKKHEICTGTFDCLLFHNLFR